jgi:hypothetical protein
VLVGGVVGAANADGAAWAITGGGSAAATMEAGVNVEVAVVSGWADLPTWLLVVLASDAGWTERSVDPVLVPLGGWAASVVCALWA